MRKKKIKIIPPLTQVVEGHISVLGLPAPNLRPPLQIQVGSFALNSVSPLAKTETI